MRCPICKNGTLRAYSGVVTRRGVAIDVAGRRCDACGETFFDDAEMGRHEHKLAEGLIAQGLRTGRDFQYVRKIAGLRATELAALLDVRPETVSRWERGEVDIPRTAAFALGELFSRPKVTRQKLEAYGRAV